MTRILLLAVALTLLPWEPTRLEAADEVPLADSRVTDDAGHYYVVWNRTGGPRHVGPFGPTEFTMAERATGTQPVMPAEAMIIANLDLYDQERGIRYHKMLDTADVCVREGDRVHGRGIFETPPRVVLVSSTGLGFVTLDTYGPNVPLVIEGHGGHAVVVVSLDGRVRHALKLADLFNQDRIARFPSGGNTISWLRGGWISERREELVVVGVGDQLRVLHLISGEVRGGTDRDVVEALDSTDPQTLKQALVLAAAGKLTDAVVPARLILKRPNAPSDVRLRAAVLLAVLGDDAGNVLIRRTAAARPANDPTDDDIQRQLRRAVAVEYLPEVSGAGALPILLDALRNGRAERGAAFTALIKLGAQSVPGVLPLTEPREDRRLRLGAVGILGGIGPSAGAAVPRLLNLLEDDDPLLRIKAAFALAHVDSAQTALRPVFREGLRFVGRNIPSRPIREAAAAWLARCQPDGTSILAEALDDPDAGVRCLAASTLGQPGVEATAVASALVESLDDEDAEVRNRVLDTLVHLGLKSRPAATAGLNHPSRKVRSGSAYVLGQVGRADIETTTHLREALADEDPLVRCAAAMALERVGGDSALAQGTLIKLLDNRDPYVRAQAAYGLGEFGFRAEAAADRLTEALSDTPRVARQAATALGKIGGARLAVVESLLGSLDHSDRLVRRAAAEGLGRLGPAARVAVPRLMELLDDADWHVPHIAAASLGQFGGEAARAVPTLVGIVEATGRETELRIAAIGALGKIDPEAEIAIRPLIEALADPCPEVAQAAAVSLAAFGSAVVSSAVLDGLIETLEDSPGYARCYAAESLGRIGPTAVSSVPSLIGALAETDAATGYFAVEPILSIGPSAVPHLGQALTNDNRHIRAAAAQILGRFGPAAKTATAALARAQADPDGYVRRRAGWALEKIAGQGSP